MRGVLFVFVVAACATPVEHHGVVAQELTKCPDQVVEGVDVFTGTGTIDWSALAGSGRGFAFIKGTQGDYNVQASFATNWSGALAAGVKRSPYHFFDGTVDGTAQANTFLAEVQTAGGFQTGDLPAMLDIECPTSATEANAQANCEHSGDSGWVPPAMLKQRIYDWLDTVEAATGRKPIIYSYPSWFAELQMTDAKMTDYPLFIASYNSCATIPQPWSDAVFWQYSATGTVPGITGGVDMDRFFGSQADLDAFAIQPAAATPDAGMVDPMQPESTGCGCRTGSPGLAMGILLILRRRAKR